VNVVEVVVVNVVEVVVVHGLPLTTTDDLDHVHVRE
jgi:hypothetical protein